MTTSLATSSPVPSKPSTPAPQSGPAVEPPSVSLPKFAAAHKVPPSVQQVEFPIKDGDEYGGFASGLLHLPADGQMPSKTAAILLSGAGGGVTGPSAMYVELAAKLPALEARIPVLRVSYRFPARTRPCVNDTRAAIRFLKQEHGVERFVLVGWSFGAAPAFFVAGQDERVVGVAGLAPQTADALDGAREAGRRSCRLLLLHGTGDKTLDPRCSESLYAAWWSKRPPGSEVEADKEELAELILYDHDDHALTRNAAKAEAEVFRFIAQCAEAEVQRSERKFVEAELVEGREQRTQLMEEGGDLRGGREHIE
ncbi:hypothetical protein JCM8097_002557 [Rhodosporidiobolus ruineniae]